MFCQNCGKQLPEHAKFCIDCGTAINQTDSCVHTAPNYQPQNGCKTNAEYTNIPYTGQNTYEYKKKPILAKIFFILSAISAVISGVCFAVKFYISNKIITSGFAISICGRCGKFGETESRSEIYALIDDLEVAFVAFLIIAIILLAADIIIKVIDKKNTSIQ